MLTLKIFVYTVIMIFVCAGW
nr:photosystem II protein I [Trentepohlia sp. BN17]UIB38742.1 photosystem II protein I [Trentepohlia sp. BN17]